MPNRQGVPNKNKRGLLAQLKQQYGKDWHPIMMMAKDATLLQERVEELGKDAKNSDITDAIKAWSAVAEYTEPKLKSIEIKGNIDVGISDLTDAELARRIKQLEILREQSL